MYKVDLKTEGAWVDSGQIYSCLDQMVREVDAKPFLPLKHRVQIMTSDSRTAWFKNRSLLVKQNSENIRAVEECLFVICLDSPVQNLTDSSISHQSMFYQMVTGGGCHKNSTNRWFDKTINLICSLDGVNGICYEHTASEGVAVVAMLTKVLNEIEKFEPNHVEGYNPAQHLDWNLDDSVVDATSEAITGFERLQQDTDLEVCSFKTYGKTFIKSCNCSPDAFVQMALQLTYYK